VHVCGASEEEERSGEWLVASEAEEKDNAETQSSQRIRREETAPV
jgi:hypothetical protein